MKKESYLNALGQVEWGKIPLNGALEKLTTTREGLSSEEAQKRLDIYGPNALPKVDINKILVFLRFMWNPLSWAMEVAAILSIVLLDYADFGLILALLLLNACIGFFEEIQAGDAVSALMDQLAPEAKVFRDGTMINLQADQLVPGDVIRIRLGDVLPADVKFLEGDPVKIDQSSLTGESLPVTKRPGDEGYSGSICKQGETEAVVTCTGVNTFLGRAAEQIAGADGHGRLQEVLTTVGNFCMVSIITWCIIELIVQMGSRNDENPCFIITDGCLGVANILVLIVGGIPVAMPTVLSVTLAIGSSALARENAIVTRLTSIEEMASMEILCSDKTGTLTLNKLSVDMDNLIPYNDFTTADILRLGALASRIENNEAIDVVCYNSYPEHDKLWQKYSLLHYTPFDPITKRTIAKIKDNTTGAIFRACKGAPQVCLNMDSNAEALRPLVEERINEFAARGYRGLGIAIASDDVRLEDAKWQLVGLMPLFDPPRHDTAETIRKALELGVAVKMVTGDHRVIAIETCRQLGMPTNILDTSFFNHTPPAGVNLAQLVYETDGFAQVFPEHKFEIVRQLQSLHKVVGMTGDGVNDAPALAQADIGIAVDDATDAARAAADIVLVSPGLSVIITAIRMSREIFLRMKNYAMYSIAMTVRIVCTFGLLTVCYNWYFPTILVVILAILNDGTILTISKDNVTASRTPDSWKLRQVFIIAICFGAWLTISTIVLFSVVYNTSAFEGFISAETLCVDCLQESCNAFFTKQVQKCTINGRSSVCGELDGSVPRNFDQRYLSANRLSYISNYWDYYTSSTNGKTMHDLFDNLANSHITDLYYSPTALQVYNQFVAQYSASGPSVLAAIDGNGVDFIGHDYIPLTNGASFCDFMWGYSNFNKTWTKDFKNIGPGRQKKDAILRALIYTQVSISGQALIFVTRTVGINTWFFAEKPCNLLLLAFVFAQIVASLIGYFGFYGYPSDRVAVIGCGGGYLVIVWIWSIVWHFPLDLIKFAVNYILKVQPYSSTAFDSRINAGHPTMSHSRVTSRARSERAISYSALTNYK
ncbi:P-type ATPase (P-ATPase) Superfamily [Thraustotheca clavata]|uniref:Plasma membrane ATPase n=1 Tax=Thraustotheca clavata TaxID=74557 RepID=A0A1V9ZF31_9STRA|nr:P-type ATPase (P-ATPase) Superfamily [Thraustotheca clavata]